MKDINWYSILSNKLLNILFQNSKISVKFRSLIQDNFDSDVKTIKKYLDIKDNDRVLDIGCGVGQFSVLSNPKKYVGIDINENYILFAKKHYQGDFFLMNGKKLQFEDNYFDRILVYGVLHHVDDKNAKKILEEIERVTKTFGKILIIEPAPVKLQQKLFGKIFYYLFEPGRYQRSRKELEVMISDYFELRKYFLMNSGMLTLQAFLLTKR